MSRVDELRLIARVAQMYHIEGKRQAEIAAILRISQATISRMLKRAVDEEIIRTTINPPQGTYSALQDALRAAFGLPEVIVVDCDQDQDAAIMARIGEAAAHFLETTLQADEIIGVSSWSETIQKMVDNIHPMRQGSATYVVQTLGGIGNPAVQTHATQLTTRLAKLTGAAPQLLPAPGVAPSSEAKSILSSDPYLRETTALFDRISLAIVGIGAIAPSTMLARSGNVFSAEELAELAKAGAVGDISLRFFNVAGEPVQTALNARVIGIDLAQLAKLDRVIGLAGGQAKTTAILGALRMGVLDVLITDQFTAERLLAMV